MFSLSKKEFKKIDLILLFTVFALVGYGLFFLYSAMNPLGLTIRSQVISTVTGIILMLFVFTIDLEFLKKIKWFLYITSIGLVLSTLVIGRGGDQWGANLWLRFGPISIQPSEISKVMHIIFLSAFIGDNKRKINTPKFIIQYLIFGYSLPAAIVLQKDIGTALVVAFFTTVMFFVSGISWKNIIKLLGIFLVAFLIAIPFIWANLDEYAKNRILDLNNNNRNIETSTHQTDRGLVALGSGQLTGRGYLNGPYTQNRYIPEHQTDFIFPALVEELGFIGGLGVLLLYFIMFARLIRIALKAESMYLTSMVVGVASLLFVHIFENIGMTMGIMPVTGIPLPFFSNGGTFQLINLFLIGLCLAISMERKSLEF